MIEYVYFVRKSSLFPLETEKNMVKIMDSKCNGVNHL